MDNQPRIDELTRKLSARRRSPGSEENCREIEAEIQRLTDEQRAQGSEGTEQPQS